MLRLIIKGTYMMPTDKAEVDYKTFDVHLPEVEEYLSRKNRRKKVGIHYKYLRVGIQHHLKEWLYFLDKDRYVGGESNEGSYNIGPK